MVVDASDHVAAPIDPPNERSALHWKLRDDAGGSVVGHELAVGQGLVPEGAGDVASLHCIHGVERNDGGDLVARIDIRVEAEPDLPAPIVRRRDDLAG